MRGNTVVWIGVGLILGNLFFKQWGLLSPLFSGYTSSTNTGSTQAVNTIGHNSPLGARING